MKRFSKSKKISTLLGAGLLMLTACAPDSLTRGGAAQPAPIERSTDDGAASNANEANVQAAPGVSAPAQAATSASSSSPLSPTLQSTPRARGEIEFTGTVEVIASDTWVVGGRTLAVTTATEIKPGLTIGMLAKVHVIPQANGTLWAREIEPTLGIDNSNSNSNDNSNSNGNSNVNDNANSNSNANSNGNVNSNDDNGNDDHSSNSNDNNSNDDHGGNSNDDNGNNDDNDNGNSNVD